MKNIFKVLFLSVAIFMVGCENEDDPRFQDNPETGWVEFPTASTTLAVTSRTAPDVSVPLRFTAPINLSDLTVNYTINPVSGVPGDVTTGLSGTVTISANTNRTPIAFTLKPGIVDELIANGDVIFDIQLTAANRGISIGLADGSARTAHRVELLCAGEPAPGDYAVDMFDSFGDGWQTDNADGGSGMTITITDLGGAESVVEIGMCSPYGGGNVGTFLDASTGSNCTGPASTSFFSASTTVNIPAGSIDAVWDFPGDNWGEISFDIYAPGGNLLWDSGGPGDQAAGVIPVSYCQ